MKEKMIVIIICMLFLIVTNFSVSGTMNHIKHLRKFDSIYNDFSEEIIQGNYRLGDWTEQKLISLDGTDEDAFGRCVSIDGDYAVIGTPHNDDNGENSGSAYIFKNNGSNWVQQQKLTASDAAESDLFGYYVSISGNHVIVGAPYNDDNGDMSGSAYIFKNIGAQWIEQQKITASDGAASDLFGFVSINGEYAIIGAPYDDDIGSNTGSIYIYKFDGVSWTEQQKLHASDTSSFIGFGTTVNINDEYAIIGAPFKDDLGSNSGCVYVFKNNEENWIENQKLTASDGVTDDLFGRCVSMDGGYIAIGAPKDDDNKENSGSVYLFKNNDSGWAEEQKITAFDGDANDTFGNCVSIDENQLIVGAENSDGFEIDTGSAYIFKCDGANWVEEEKFTASDSETEDFFGETVSIFGNFAIVGAGLDDNINGVDAGSVYIFRRANQPPNKPSITGPGSGKPGKELCWTFQSSDPDGDDIMYLIDWDDGTVDLTECVESGTSVKVCHTYSNKSTYTIKAKTIECNPDGSQSDWSILKVKINRYRNYIVSRNEFTRVIKIIQILTKFY